MKNNIVKHSYGRYFSAGTMVIIVSLVIIPALVFIYKNLDSIMNEQDSASYLLLFLSFIYLVIGLLGFVPREEFQVNVQDNTYRNAVVFFKRVTGEWKNLGKIKYLSIRVKKSSIEGASASGNVGMPATMRPSEKVIIGEYQLRLYKGPGRFIEIDTFGNKKKVIEVGAKFTKALELELLDASIEPASFVIL